jgi:allantoinase
VLYAEGATQPKMLSIGLHARIIGRPGRFGGLARLVDHITAHDHVWVCRRVDIAQHWINTFPAPIAETGR